MSWRGWTLERVMKEYVRWKFIVTFQEIQLLTFSHNSRGTCHSI